MAELKAEVPSVKLSNGILMPMLGFGTGTAMSKSDHGKIDKETVEQIKTAIKLGYRHLDGAEIYGTEIDLGKAIKESGISRDELFVTTKVHRNISNIPEALDASLKNLGLDHVDLYLIHAPFFAENDSDLQKAWSEMEAVHKTGKARTIGVSNYLIPDLRATMATATVTPAVNQTEFHLYLQRGELLSFCKEHNIVLSAYGPITPATKAAPGPADALLGQMAKKYAVSEGEICLRWCIDQGVVPITTSSKEQRMSDYLRIAAFKLTPREIEELNQVGLEKHYRGFWGKKFKEDDRS